LPPQPQRVKPAARPRLDGPDFQDSPTDAAGQRLNKRMAELGLASRREADEWIERGWVRVNGKLARMGQPVTEQDAIEIDPAARRAQAESITILIHKPMGIVSSQAEDGYEPAVTLIKPETQYVPKGGKAQRFERWHLRGIAVAGRLDIDSTGLLVLTQDGRVARVLIGEDSDVEKEYLVRVRFANEGQMIEKNVQAVLPPERIALLKHGIALDGVALKPAKVSWQNEEQLRIVLREGRKRQIRRMCEAVGLEVAALKRVRIGRVVLGDLPVGQWRYLTPFEKF
jgi:23S rRNA pseudouridine2604 synthase